ncbi:MAG: hypothetical protein NXH87_11825 [Rhodobiaceae bacterium]|nr:hypothetical protein [Rhodobiaceae bacterium]
MLQTKVAIVLLKKRVASIICLLAGAALVLLAMPRTIVSYASLPARVAYFDIQQGANPSLDRLISIERDITLALENEVGTSELNTLLSYFRLYRITLDDKHPSDEETRLVLEAVKDGLRRHPLSASLWTRYAHASYLLNGMDPYTLAALDKSFLYGSHEADLFRFRITLCVHEWSRLPSSLKEKVLAQIELGAAHPHVWGEILAGLSGDAETRMLDMMRNVSADVERAKLLAAIAREKQNSR